jgi:regulator of replication initiation timing
MDAATMKISRLHDENFQLRDDLTETNDYISRLHDDLRIAQDEIARLKIENDKLSRKIHAAVVYGRLPS